MDTDIKESKTTLTLFVITLILLGGTALLSSSINDGFGANPNETSTVSATPTEIQTVYPTSTGTVIIPTQADTKTQIRKATPTPSTTPVLTSSPSPTQTPTLGPYANEKYGPFISAVVGEAEVDAEVPVRLRGWRVIEGEVLIIVMNLTARSEDEQRRVREVNTLVTGGYTQAVAHYDNGKIDGKIPSRLVIAEVNNTNNPPKTLYVNTSLAREYYSGQLNAPEFTDRYWNTTINMTDDQQEYAHEMDVGAGNITLYNETAD